MTLTEFNQNPSRVVRLITQDPGAVIRVTKRGVALLEVRGVVDDDPVSALVRAGLAAKPAKPSGEPVAYDDETLPPGLDLTAELQADRSRVG